MSNASYPVITVAGDGWGAVAAVKSCLACGIVCEVLTGDPDVIALLPSQQGRVHQSLDDVTTEIVVFAGFKPIVPKAFLQKHQCMNVHYSLLPEFRGLHSTVWAILMDAPRLGLTIHLMDEDIDNGDIIAQYAVTNDGLSSATWYMMHLNEWVEQHLGEVLLRFTAGSLASRPQDTTLATWVPRRKLEDCRLNFYHSFGYLQRMFRALTPPYPGPFVETAKHGRRWAVERIRLHPQPCVTFVGRVLNIDRDGGVWVCHPEGFVVLEGLTPYEVSSHMARLTIGTQLLSQPAAEPRYGSVLMGATTSGRGS
jgi:methionyl-tRNA formyltransferase